MQQSRRLLMAIAFVCAATVSPAGSANLIANGDFESQLLGGGNAANGFRVRHHPDWLDHHGQHGP